MRPIKLRAWHREREQMLTVECIDWVSKLEGDDDPGFVVHEEDTGTSDSYGGPGEPCYATSLKDVNLMQFTGIKDRNGKEIYEGDIVSYEDIHEGERHTDLKNAVVDWDDFEMGFKLAVPNGNGTSVYPPCDCATYEVLGNVHEHPQLLPQAS